MTPLPCLGLTLARPGHRAMLRARTPASPGKNHRASYLGYLEEVPVCPVSAGFLRASIHPEPENLGP